ncbi:class I SAM-dependent methyltransferase [Loktanella sp. S4079]|uniref:class I SAM-dependent methyltransferase n=1 Tax=Loktanella sp. S4079 TaxID=579483 RepID=UPI0005FA8844|nr:class I SAM-dependent methyltransferase [Loktanella sp. S4079]KJZ18639.1 SAM-dependent methyltransferase [Loktanella sp. S4079]
MATHCRFCNSQLEHVVVDLGLSPVSNRFRDMPSADHEGQMFYPLKVMVCDTCWLVQLTDVTTPPHFDENYAYFSSFSVSWLAHAKRYADMMQEKLNLGPDALVVEVASNDGYLLQYFKKAGIKVLGIEPSANVAAHAKEQHGIESIVDFFGENLGKSLREKGVSANLIAGNNVLAHVPDINDFIAGIELILAPDGTVTFEFPHLLQMLTLGQFDTIYHEHYSYLSLLTVEKVLNAHGLSVYGVEELPTHGGSLRVFAKHTNSDVQDNTLAKQLEKVRRDEATARLNSHAGYSAFAARPAQCKADLLAFLIEARKQGKTVCGYGAPAKGNTMLDYCGIGPELLPFTTDLSPQKQGKFLPGANIPVHDPSVITETRPDYILILPWNLRDEIEAQLKDARDWGGKFVVAVPELEIF